jgi:hypothetical protein
MPRLGRDLAPVGDPTRRDRSHRPSINHPASAISLNEGFAATLPAGVANYLRQHESIPQCSSGRSPQRRSLHRNADRFAYRIDRCPLFLRARNNDLERWPDANESPANPKSLICPHRTAWIDSVPGVIRAVPDNTRDNVADYENDTARYYRVTLSNPGTITLDMNPQIDALSIEGAQSQLVIGAPYTLEVLLDTSLSAGTLTMLPGGTLTTGTYTQTGGSPASRRLAACLGLGSGPQAFAYLPWPRLQKAWLSQVKIIVHSPAAHSGADLIDCDRHRARVSRRLDKASAGQDMIQPGPGSRSPSQKRTLPVQRSIRRAVGASPVQWFVSVIAAAINAPATTSVTCCRFMTSLRPPRSAHEMGAGTAHSPYRCSVFSAVLPQNPHAPQAGR